MKVVILSNRFFSISNSRQKIIKSLIRDGHEVLVLASFDGFEKDILAIDNSGAIRCEDFSFSASPSLLKNTYSLKKKLQHEKPDLVHAFNPIPIFISAHIKSSCNYKLVITITGLGGAYGHKSKSVKLFDQLYKFSMKRADRLVFQNKDDFEYFSAKLPESILEITEVITSSGVDMARFPEKHFSAENKNSEVFKILFIARLIKQKGITYLTQIAEKLSDHRDVQIHIFGEYIPNHKDSISKKEYNQLLELKNVYFHGFVKNIEDYYIQHDLLICCSLREGVPRVILEASATGVPVVAFDVTGVREGIEEGVNGYLIEAFNVDVFVDKILELKNDTNLYSSISKVSRSYIEKKFSQKIILEKYKNIYNTFSELKSDA